MDGNKDSEYKQYQMYQLKRKNWILASDLVLLSKYLFNVLLSDVTAANASPQVNAVPCIGKMGHSMKSSNKLARSPASQLPHWTTFSSIALGHPATPVLRTLLTSLPPCCQHSAAWSSAALIYSYGAAPGPPISYNVSETTWKCYINSNTGLAQVQIAGR